MAEQPEQIPKASDSERATRLRNNKRRHRARQKEYVQDLESKLAEYRDQRVEATKEVQAAAQRVIRENARLKDLLRRTGYSDEAIDSWVNQDWPSGCAAPAVKSNEGIAISSTSGVAAKEVSHCCSVQNVSSLESAKCAGVCDDRRSSLPIHAATSSKYPHTEESSNRVESPDLPNPASLIRQTSTESCAGSCNSEQLEKPSRSSIPPCKLLSRLEENPATDITQIPLPPGSEEGTNIEEGIECSKAYKMLMQYATSEAKLADIAQALEAGCTPMNGGGCKVKSTVIFNTLDKVIE